MTLSGSDSSLPPGTCKIEFAFGPSGLSVTKDEVESVSGQAQAKGVEKGWKVLMIDGQDFNADESNIKPTLMKKAKAGKKYTVVFSKGVSAMKSDLARQQDIDNLRKEKFLQDEKERKAASEIKKSTEEVKKSEIEGRKAAYAESVKRKIVENTVSVDKLAKFGEVPDGIKLSAPKSIDSISTSDLKDTVTIKYCHYSEKFPLTDSATKITTKAIDGVYSLTDVMPNCSFHLSTHEFAHDEQHFYVKESSDSTPTNQSWDTLTPGCVYFLYVQQDRKQYEADMKRMKDIYEKVGKDSNTGGGMRKIEGCSCLYGCPCQDKYTCLDWENRVAVAKAHGMLPLG